MNHRLDDKSKSDILMFMDKINIIINVNKKQDEMIDNMIDKENQKYDFTSIHTNASSEKNCLMHSFILENHNFIIEQCKNKQSRLLRYSQRCNMQKVYLNCLLKGDAMDQKRSEIQIVNLIQSHAIRQLEDDIKVLKQKKLKLVSFNRYIKYLQTNGYLDEFNQYKDELIKDEEIQKIDIEKDLLHDKYIKLRQIFIGQNYSFDSSKLYNPDFLNNDVLKVVEILYPSFKDVSFELDEKFKKAM